MAHLARGQIGLTIEFDFCSIVGNSSDLNPDHIGDGFLRIINGFVNVRRIWVVFHDQGRRKCVAVILDYGANRYLPVRR